MFTRAALVHYHEIGLKGRNRSTFERRLRDNIAAAVAHVTPHPVERISSRLLVRCDDLEAIEDLVATISRIPGVSSVSTAYVTSRESDQLNRAALLALREVPQAATFAVKARRSNTDHPVSSMDMNRQIGQYLVDNVGLKVDLGGPDATVRVEVVGGDAYVYSRKVPGIGGLPTGTSGTVISLLSAGIDSPVATWRIVKRGAVAVGVHFSGRPQTNDASDRLVAEIGEVLERTGGLGRIYFVPFGDLQKEIALAAPPDLRVLLYRRLMIRVAERIARVEKAKALVTGESLGQVASQTLDNIRAVDEAASLPVLRPLIGSDKLEIIAEARAIGTYELSTQDHTDCCTLFMPRSPETHATVRQVLDGECDLDIGRMVDDAISGATFRDYSCPAYRPPRRTPQTARDEEGGR